MRIGYSWWGFLADRKFSPEGVEVSTPDGNATYSWSIVYEAIRRGWTVVPLQEDRDSFGVENFGSRIFKAFSKEKRTEVYFHLQENGWSKNSHNEFPELDILILEWRFPIPGRNTPDAVGQQWWQGDLQRQTELLNHYSNTSTKIFVWDLDHKLTIEDEKSFAPNVSVIETALIPLEQHLKRISVYPPFCGEELLQHETVKSTHVHMSYIGSRYERDIIIDEWIAPYANNHRGNVHFYGKWEPKDELYQRWPGVVFHDRIGVTDFRNAYKTAACVPLLAKQSYRENGFMTPRPFEALLFGSIPIGLGGHLGVEEYVFKTAELNTDMEETVSEMSKLSLSDRDNARKKLAELYSEIFSSKQFLDILVDK